MVDMEELVKNAQAYQTKSILPSRMSWEMLLQMEELPSAYSKLQYTDKTTTEALKNSLFRYCELDTMAMVLIWEFFYNETR